MGYWDEFESIERTVAKPGKRSFDQIVDDTVKRQIDILNGKEFRTSKGTLQKSWRDSETGIVDPKISNMNLLPKKKLVMGEETYRKFLSDMEGWRDNPEIKAIIEDIPVRQEQNKKNKSNKMK